VPVGADDNIKISTACMCIPWARLFLSSSFPGRDCMRIPEVSLPSTLSSPPPPLAGWKSCRWHFCPRLRPHLPLPKTIRMTTDDLSMKKLLTSEDAPKRKMAHLSPQQMMERRITFTIHGQDPTDPNLHRSNLLSRIQTRRYQYYKTRGRNPERWCF